MRLSDRTINTIFSIGIGFGFGVGWVFLCLLAYDVGGAQTKLPVIIYTIFVLAIGLVSLVCRLLYPKAMETKSP